VTWLFGAIGVLVSIVGLVACALVLRLGLLRRDWVIVMAALASTGAFLYTVVWLRDAL